jgi:hypothetical protein
MSLALKERKTSIKSGSSISEDELEQRVAVIKRFKDLLAQQRDRFRTYLDVLDRQQLLIGYGSAEEITAHVELEEQIVADIFSIQKVIAPLEIMYNAVSNAADAARTANHDDDIDDLGTFITINDVPELQATLEGLKIQAVARSMQNRDMLSSRMKEIDSDIQTIKNNPFLSKARNALYQNVSPSLVDVMG